MKDSMRKKRKEGFALIATIIIVAVALTVIAVGLFTMQKSSISTVVGQSKSMQAYYLARSGAVAVTEWINAHPDKASGLIDKTSSPVHLKNGSVGTVEVSVEATDNGLIIVSTGRVNDAKETLRLSLINGFTFNKAIIAKSFPNGIAGKITGGIEYQGNESTITVNSGANIDGIEVLPDVHVGGATEKVQLSVIERLTPLPTPTGPASDMIVIDSPNTTINTAGSYYVATDSAITIPSGNPIEGTLTIVSPFNVDIIFESGNTKIDNLYLYVPNGSVDLQGGVKTSGSIVANTVRFINGNGNNNNGNGKDNNDNGSDNGFTLTNSSTTSTTVQFPSDGYTLGSWSY